MNEQEMVGKTVHSVNQNRTRRITGVVVKVEDGLCWISWEGSKVHTATMCQFMDFSPDRADREMEEWERAKNTRKW